MLAKFYALRFLLASHSFSRIENRLSELWTKSATDIEEGLDEILTVKKTPLRKISIRPHRPKDRMKNASDLFGSEPSATKCEFS